MLQHWGTRMDDARAEREQRLQLQLTWDYLVLKACEYCEVVLDGEYKPCRCVTLCAAIGTDASPSWLGRFLLLRTCGILSR